MATCSAPNARSRCRARRLRAEQGTRVHSYTLIGIGLLVAVALLSKQEQRKGAWLLAAVVIVLIADRMR